MTTATVVPDEEEDGLSVFSSACDVEATAAAVA